ncbi:Lem3/Cdc50, partial [Atractiella rhizophila]
MGLFNRKSSPTKEKDDSISNAGEKKKASRRPANTAFKQQRLKAWQPILTPRTVLPAFFLIGIIFGPIGGLLLYGSNKVNEFTLNYTDCDLQTETPVPLPDDKFDYSLSSGSASTGNIAKPTYSFTNGSAGPICLLEFEVPKKLEKNVFMYYKLTRYYQNHRRYVQSLDTDQLKGSARSAGTLNKGACDPLASQDGLPIYPCGLIANSFFNDTFLPPVLLNPAGSTGQNQTYNMTDQGIAWPGEKKKYGKTKYAFDQVVPPPFWQSRYPNGRYTEGEPGSSATSLPDLSQDEHFQVWMRTAGLPTFRKLYFKNENEDMAPGRYQIQITMNYPVRQFKGSKQLVFSTVSFIGGKNPFLGIVYIVVGGVCFLLGLALTLRHIIKPRKLGDLRYL